MYLEIEVVGRGGRLCCVSDGQSPPSQNRIFGDKRRERNGEGGVLLGVPVKFTLGRGEDHPQSPSEKKGGEGTQRGGE